jgi:SagB-type dehydrogenase family enzyme
MAFDCITSTRCAIPADAIPLLAAIDDWHTPRALIRRHPDLGAEDDLVAVLETFARLGVVQKRRDAGPDWPWSAWMPEAALFHFGTRNLRYAASTLEYEPVLRAKARSHPPPAATKSVAGPRVRLPEVSDRDALSTVLQNRRTWRRFSPRPLTLVDLSRLLRLTFGVQRWEQVRGQGPVVLKTSPSGGARHSIEAYLIARRVDGIDEGIYHYDAASHALVGSGHGIAQHVLTRALANQDYFAPAAAIVVMTAVFNRVMWRYPFSRAYRTVLAEAGHHGQTFCLLATALNLAPFCTMAFRDSELESLIGVDGVHESAIYVVGVGTRPRGRVANPGRIPRSQPSTAHKPRGGGPSRRRD